MPSKRDQQTYHDASSHDSESENEGLLPSHGPEKNTKRSQQTDVELESQRTALKTSKPRTWLVRLRRYRWLVDTILLLFNISLSLLLVRDIWKSPVAESAPAVGSGLQVGGDVSWAASTFTTKVTKWEADPTFVPNNTMEFFGDETLNRWKTMFPASASRPETETFSTTSMTHQLHCLFMMGRVYAGVVNHETHRLPTEYHRHFLHCIDYLRQGVMCAGDVSLEPHSPKDADDLGAKDGGWNGIHVCKNYDEVLTYLDEEIAEGVRTVLPVDD